MGIDDVALQFTLLSDEEYEPIEDRAVEKLAGRVNQAEFRSVVLALGLGKAVSRYAERTVRQQAPEHSESGEILHL